MGGSAGDADVQHCCAVDSPAPRLRTETDRLSSVSLISFPKSMNLPWSFPSVSNECLSPTVVEEVQILKF